MAEKEENVAPVKEAEAAPAEPATVPKAQFDALLKEATDLQKRFNNLLVAYNTLFESYLNK